MTKPRILIAGVYTPTDAYPNVKYRLKYINESSEIDTEEYNAGTPGKINYSSKSGQLLSMTLMGISLVLANFRALLQIVRQRKKVDTVYIPYPAIPLLWLLSFLPNFLRPGRIVADVFISLYDTIVIDRQLLAEEKWPSRVLWKAERRAILISSVSLTDTPENSHYYSELFNIDIRKFSDLPLSIVGDHFRPANHEIDQSRDGLRILFIGTLVPLHGIDVLCRAIEMVDKKSNVTFTFIGDGQQSNVLHEFLTHQSAASSNIVFHWIKEWQDSQSLARHVHDSDICVGILNPKGKSQRVWPFKNYLYMACGRPLVTTLSPTSTRLSNLSDYPAFFEVDTDSPEPLAKLINSLIEDRSSLTSMGRNSRQFYDTFLSEKYIGEKLIRHLIPE